MDDCLFRKLLKAVEKETEGFGLVLLFSYSLPGMLGNRERYVYRGVPDGGKN